MSTLTIHALDPAVEARIRAKAKRDGKSLNRTLKELLEDRVGGGSSSGKSDRRADFAEFHGIWSARDALDFQAATAHLEAVNPADWKS